MSNLYGFESYLPNSDIPGYEVVTEFGEWDYSWSTMRVYKRDGRLFYITDSGCSCYGWDDSPKSESDLIALPTLEAARNAVKDFMGDYDARNYPETVLTAVEKFRELGLR